ncbi:MAG: FadR family transcriptional regulator, partial [Desulfobacterales bacterium]|nr:FadR family transcriptional regulator [Desulfobacterales bacterium]
KRHIVINNLSTGDRLPQEKELIDMFQSSRGTVREALKSLEVQGLVEIVSGPRGGARLSPVSYERASGLLTNYFHFKHLTGDQIYAMRAVLEPMVVADVTGRLTDADFQAMDETIDICRAGTEGGYDRIAVHGAELEFHNIIIRVCSNPLLTFNCLFINDLLLHFLSYSAPLHRFQKVSEQNLDYHIRLVEALRDGDGRAAADLMREHIETVGRRLRDHEAAIEQGLVRGVNDPLFGWTPKGAMNGPTGSRPRSLNARR